MADQPPLTLSGHFHGQPVESHPERWNSLWQDHQYTPWDRGGPSLALSDLLQARPDLFGTAGQSVLTALVPGCGRGHDVLLLASLGYDAFGLEVSPSALAEARKNADSLLADNATHEQTGLRGGKHHWVAGNFFDSTWIEEANVQRFDLIFDYTVSQKLPPCRHVVARN
jgi:methyl halide transferase